MNKKQVTSQFLRSLADLIDAMSAEEFQEVLRTAGLGLVIAPASGKRQSTKINRGGSGIKESADILMNYLASVSSREEALSYLEEQGLSRAVLFEAAKMRALHIMKNDTIATISEKLVANTVGSRLDSAAIRNG